MSEYKYFAKKYIRLSRADEKKGTDESNSVKNQRMLLDGFIAQNPDIKDMGEQVDDGFSGVIFDRPAFKELMAEIHEGKINCIIVKDLSRFGREYIETGNYLRRILPAYGVRFIALGDGIDTAKGSDGADVMITVKNVVNDAYSRDISVKTRSALNGRREKGKYVASYAMYGYRKSEEDKNKLVIDEYPSSIVRDIYRMKIDGYSAAGIAAELNRRGVLCPLAYRKSQGLPHAKRGFADVPGAQWAPVAVLRILSDETYTGTLVQGRKGKPNYRMGKAIQKPEEEWIRVENAHEAIIERNDFELMRRLLVMDTRAPKGEKKALPFSGILICGACNNRMTRKTVALDGKQYHYWYCPTGKLSCKAPVMLEENALTECVLESLKAHVANVASLESLLMAQMTERMQGKLARQYQAQIDVNMDLLKKATALKASLAGSLMDGSLSKPIYKELKQGYDSDIQKAQAVIKTSQAALDTVLSGGDERLRWMERFREFGNLAELDRRTVVSLIHSIRITGKGTLEVRFNFKAEYDKALARLTAPAGGGKKEVA